MRLLVKLGGTLLDSDASLKRLAAETARGWEAGHRIVLVHGGGRQMTRFLAERGIESRFVDGLRVTTPETIDAVLKVFAGSVNHSLLAALVAAGVQAVGLSGIDASLVEAEPMRPELGAVGRPGRANPELMELLAEAGYLPVVACVAADRKGNIYNVNADQMAVACAIGFRAERLLFLTDVEGVLGASGERLPRLTLHQSEELIRAGIARGGMQAKLNSAGEALRAGIAEVIVAPGAAQDIIPRLLSGEELGTRLVLDEGAA